MKIRFTPQHSKGPLKTKGACVFDEGTYLIIDCVQGGHNYQEAMANAALCSVAPDFAEELWQVLVDCYPSVDQYDNEFYDHTTGLLHLKNLESMPDCEKRIFTLLQRARCLTIELD